MGEYQANKEIQHATMRSSYRSERMSQTSPTPLGSGELLIALTKLKRGKTSGASGMSQRTFGGIGASPWWTPARPQHHAFTRLFLTQTLPEAWHVSSPKSHKQRLLVTLGLSFSSKCRRNCLRPSSWLDSATDGNLCLPKSGALSGGQAIEALSAARTMMNVAKVTANDYLFISYSSKWIWKGLRQLATRECWLVLDLRGLKLSLGSRQAITPLGVTNAWVQLAWIVEHPQHLWSPRRVVVILQACSLAPWTSSWASLQSLGHKGGSLLRSTHYGFFCMWMELAASPVSYAIFPGHVIPPRHANQRLKACKIAASLSVTSVLLGTPDAECTFPTLHKFQWCETTTYNLNPTFWIWGWTSTPSANT